MAIDVLHCTPLEAMERLTSEDLELLQAEYAIRAEERAKRDEAMEEEREQREWEAQHGQRARRVRGERKQSRTMGEPG